MEVTCHPRLGGALAEGGGHGMHMPDDSDVTDYVSDI